MTKADSVYLLARDPYFYITLVLFSLLTTTVPALLGRMHLLPLGQTLLLFAFMLLGIRQLGSRGGIRVLALWITIQLLAICLLSIFRTDSIEQAIGDGFLFRADLLEWFYVGGDYPHPQANQYFWRWSEPLAVVVGSLISAGFLGLWFAVRAVNALGFSIGVLLSAMQNPQQIFLAIPLWTLTLVVGYVIAIVVCAQPMLSGKWSLEGWQAHVRSIRSAPVLAALLILLGILFTLFLSGFLQQLIN